MTASYESRGSEPTAAEADRRQLNAVAQPEKVKEELKKNKAAGAGQRKGSFQMGWRHMIESAAPPRHAVPRSPSQLCSVSAPHGRLRR